MKYDELVKALRYCIDGTCGNCPYVEKCKKNGRAVDQLHKDAAAAIEALQADLEEQKQIAAHYEQTAKDYWKEACDYKAEVERLEPKRGEWIHSSGDEWYCPFCLNTISTEGSWEHPHETGKFFCGNCGSDLRGNLEVKE